MEILDEILYINGKRESGLTNYLESGLRKVEER